MHARMCPSILEGTVSQTSQCKDSKIKHKELIADTTQALTKLKRFSDRAICAYAPRLWNELPDNIKAADSVQNLKKQLKTLLFRKQFIWLYGHDNCPLTFSKALLHIIGGKGAISNINHYYY